jgi:hypothetical protein
MSVILCVPAQYPLVAMTADTFSGDYRPMHIIMTGLGARGGFCDGNTVLAGIIARFVQRSLLHAAQ